jgi:hypothetical protein
MHTTRLGLLALLALAWHPSAPGSPATAAQPPHPNILFAFADDLGRHTGIYAQVDGPGRPRGITADAAPDASVLATTTRAALRAAYRFSMSKPRVPDR